MKNCREQLLFCPANYKDQRYGSGWMWDDNFYDYQAEKTPLPIYANTAHFIQNDTTKGIQVKPIFWQKPRVMTPTLHEDDFVGRVEYENQFTLNTLAKTGKKFECTYRFMPRPTLLPKCWPTRSSDK
ncbi:MAG: hypothetical protein IPM82_09845 [Saprospiraceae bacterium]|nr:hypothetical protein [Saprospiraceae bacterium]